MLPIADVKASFSSHILTHLPALLDLSLYISSLNFPLTRRAWTQLLPFPTQYHLPSLRRTLARSRTQHLKISTLDLDGATEEEKLAKRRDSIVPEHLRGFGKPTLTSLLRQEGAKDRFRLDALIDAALEPLSELLGEKRWFLTDEGPSILDTLALGYLSPALVPELPAPWLREGMLRYPNLCKFVEKGTQKIYKGKVTAEEALSSCTQAGQSGLPWHAPTPITNTDRLFSFVGALKDQSPTSFWRDYRIVNTPMERKVTQESGQTSNVAIPLAGIAAATAAAICAYTYFGFGFGLGTSINEETKLGDMGEAGAVLNMFEFEAGSPPPQGNESNVRI